MSPSPDVHVLREAVGQLSPRWRVELLLALNRGPRRYNELLRAVDGISGKMLTQALRGMERDGVLRREESGPGGAQVTYELSDIGRSLLGVLGALNEWAREHLDFVQMARLNYDEPDDERVVVPVGVQGNGGARVLAPAGPSA